MFTQHANIKPSPGRQTEGFAWPGRGERSTASAAESLADRVNASGGDLAPQTKTLSASAADLTDEVRLSPLLPSWLLPLDTITLAFLNLTLVLMVTLIFANTVYRSVVGDFLILGIEEISHLLLLTVAFVGGATAFARGDFMAMKVFIQKAPLPARNFACNLPSPTGSSFF